MVQFKPAYKKTLITPSVKQRSRSTERGKKAADEEAVLGQ